MRDLDLVLWGATGYTGRLVAAYLASHAPRGLRWAVAGRDRARLERLRGAIGVDVEVLAADALDAASVGALARRARVVASTVGPYARYGTPLVEACVEHGTDCCDITGEVPWMRDNIDRLHERAGRSGARIVHCCGFDSIPSDLGVWMLHDHLRRRHGRRLAEARLCLVRARGGFSGGTVASLLGVLGQAAADGRVSRLLGDPYALDPPGSPRGGDGPDQRGATWDPALRTWTAPFVMASINTRVVRRTNALLGHPYGRDFRYSETMAAPGRLRAAGLVLTLGAVMLAGRFGPSRRLLSRLLPRPGHGPSEAEREAGFFEIRLLGRSDGAAPLAVEGTVAGDRDPGYAETAKMLAESALCLALDGPRGEGGILTPAAALGGALLERLRAAGSVFEVRDGTPGG